MRAPSSQPLIPEAANRQSNARLAKYNHFEYIESRASRPVSCLLPVKTLTDQDLGDFRRPCVMVDEPGSLCQLAP
jgi:hypothetical protein